MKIFNDFKIKRILSLIALVVIAFFLIIFMFLGTNEGLMIDVFKNVEIDASSKIIHGLIMGIAGLEIAVLIISLALEVAKRNNSVLVILNSIINFLLLVLAIANKRYNVLLLVLALIISIVFTIYMIIFGIKNRNNEEETDEEIEERKGVLPTIIMLVASLVATFLIFFLPVCFYNGNPYFQLINALGSNASIVNLVSFIAFFTPFIAVIIYFSKIIIYSKNNTQRFYTKARLSLYLSFLLTIAFYLYSIIIEFTYESKQDFTVTSSGTVSFIPFIITGIIVIVNSILSAKYIKNEDKDTNPKLLNRTITLLFTLAFIGLLVGSLFSNIIVIDFESSKEIATIRINGFEILTNYKNLEHSEYQAIAFLIYGMLISAVIMLTTTVTLYFRKSRFFYKMSFFTIITSFVLLVALALFGKYYEIAEHINRTTINDVLAYYGLNVSIDYNSTVTSQTIFFAMGGLALLVLLAIIKPFSKQLKDEALGVKLEDMDELGEALGNATSAGSSGLGLAKEDLSDAKMKDFDSCPAFSEIDNEEDEILKDLEERKEMEFINPTLPQVVRFIVEYAKESRLHLSYKEEDIAQFIAGLGSSRLSILQGMSGTGKTSLPKIFSEAILGDVNIIEVESSWKDKNELIGYYNEFSSKFTPKKFTQSLYRAKFSSDVITFIVLDEMNLSRIEYYFSDFLSLMENEEDKREIKLLNVQLKNIKKGRDIGYKMLTKGHTIKIPSNVWFIGTANRDESTFEISDKVYDRAMTMNFTKRAPKIKAFNEPIDKRFLGYDTFKHLLDDAITNFNFDASTNKTIREVEKLVAPYNISFGNRIEKQIESFVSVYCSCFTEPDSMVDEAVEKILLSKVVAKLEFKSVENKEELAHSFEKLGLLECASFVSKLNEDI